MQLLITIDFVPKNVQLLLLVDLSFLLYLLETWFCKNGPTDRLLMITA